ncbi:hypothetical protein BGW36DRAFT_370538 [Talaromyces proteolyticus]|uniref:Translation initiation factor 3 N-terminal domain-containing protein n=1 Tax=Talaromyces proteolyticus TaxID=1131652 RepID=A0AAD4Q5K2_9EURO|nr:uncharacterized protein BGW36DRAFT_370538 [Talaromyces proteolyticus]KAH8704075.1 hypothetical protein BGW36DRAFT_370538 [Talaromyces proteolyticus]
MRYIYLRGLQSLRQRLLSSSHIYHESTLPISRSHPLSVWAPQSRFYSRGVGGFPSTPGQATGPKPQRYSRPTNEEIEANVIQLVNENGQLELPTLKNNVLISLRRDSQILVQLDPGGAGRNTVCKVMNIKDLRDQERAKENTVRLAKHAAKTSHKQIELNWSIDPHDLAHRLKKLTSFLEKDKTVEIVLTRKKGKRAATAPEIQQLLDHVQSTVQAANAHQAKPMDGEPGKTLTITVEKKN